MLYMIGGPSSVGKSTLSKSVSSETGFSILSTDALTDALAVAGFSTAYGPKKAEWFLPFLEAFIKRNLAIFEDYIIEGDAFFPKQIERLQAQYPLKAIFLVNTKPVWDDIVRHRHTDRWMDSYDKSLLVGLPDRIAAASKSIQTDCNELGIPCVDVSIGFKKAQELAHSALLQ